MKGGLLKYQYCKIQICPDHDANLLAQNMSRVFLIKRLIRHCFYFCDYEKKLSRTFGSNGNLVPRVLLGAVLPTQDLGIF